MLVAQEQYVEFVQFLRNRIETTASTVSPSMDSIQQFFPEMANCCTRDIEQTRLLVPITGAFSAGKSSLLNALLEKNLLPIAITPETALAAELHFDTRQRIEAITHTGEVETFDMSSFNKVTNRASEFEYLRVYIDSPVLKKIEPLVLVDMPGFDSPLDTHNKAILNFIDRGLHYVVLVSVEEGGLTSQVLNRLQGILDNGRSFSLCLSKADLKSPPQVKEIAEHITDQLSARLGLSQEVVVFDQTSASGKLHALIDGIDPNRLVRSLFDSEVKRVFFRLDSDTNTLLATLGKNAKDIEEAQAELRSAVARLESEKEQQLKKLRESNEGARHVQSVLSSVKQRLEECTDQLAHSAMLSQEALSQQVNELVQGALVGALRKAHGKLSSEAVMDFSRAMEGSIRTGFALPPDMICNLIDQLKEPLTTAIISKAGKASGTKGGAGGIAATGSSAAMIALAAGLGPWGVAAAAIIPGVVDWLVGAFKENRQREQIIEALRNQVFPDITRQLRQQVEIFLQETIENAVKSLACEYEEHLSRQRQILAEAEKNQNLAQIEERRLAIQTMQAELRKRAEIFLFSA